MAKRVTPTARTLQHCRKLSIPCDVVERWIGPPGVPAMRKRRDLFGFIDLVAMDASQGVLGIQACSDGDVSTRVAKIRTQCYALARAWLERGNRIEVWGWAKKGPRGKAKRWTLRVVPIVIADLGAMQGIDVAPIKPGEGIKAFARDVARQKRKRKPKSKQLVLDVDSFHEASKPHVNKLVREFERAASDPTPLLKPLRRSAP